jgi:glutamate racemase
MQSAVNTNPIGIFDSGIGGLTIAHAVAQTLPHENIIYFGDTAHFPWGDKSTAAIQAYSIKICDMLLKQHCKVILIACNTASSAAYELVKEYVGSKALVINVIDPLIDHIRQIYPNKTIGLIGTKQTVHSNVYKKKVDELDLNITLNSLATPLLAPMIEECFSDITMTKEIIAGYLAQPELEHIEALILGCTHYPLIRKEIEQYYQHKIRVLDCTEIVAKELQVLLAKHKLLNTDDRQPLNKFYVSDYTESFATCAKQFFLEDIQLEPYPLWE